MSGIWFALAAVAVGLVIRWYIIGETNLAQSTDAAGSRRKEK
jgi:hypothetical protein